MDKSLVSLFDGQANSKRGGFTLLELLISVATIGILISIAVPSFHSYANRAKRASVVSELSAVVKTVKLLRTERKAPLPVIGSTCTGCLLKCPTMATCTIPTTGLDTYNLVFGTKDAKTLPKDPWGSAYYLDENEMEFGSEDCRYDGIWSSGQNRAFEGTGDGDDVSGDDIILRIPLHTQRGCPQSPMFVFGPNYKE